MTGSGTQGGGSQRVASKLDPNQKKVVNGLEELPCLNVAVNVEGLEKLSVIYGATIEDSRVYHVSYIVPSDFVGTPRISFMFKYTC
ncbi:uncharacterized protein N7482_010309 [Penicillium canariense]|uniref:Uncharacterized protein n=1 Tax=Penicillium canariense TaxID=189055 RepID=A0A9W9LEA2_9EURO|nr:uncharacterized protein N7482_010309 [Penicillium canariense]KAJ5151057.1 hypothetical protein N7482_010309 [Penicillium canariense]